MKKDEQPKDAQVHVRLSSADKSAIKTKAQRAGLDISDYMRRAALRQKIEERLPAEVRRSLTSVGSNLASIARLAQAGKLEQVDLNQLKTIVELLTKALQ